MKFISWNVNGLRACIQKGFLDAFQRLNADFFCLQETKLQAGQLDLELPGYHQYWNYAEKKGYSGTAVFTKHEPREVTYGMGIPELDTEGRLITLEYDEFYLVTCYTPNAQRGLARLDHRLIWEVEFRKYLVRLDSRKPVILCGDLNVAHKEIDLKNPSSNRGSAGFSDQEREAFGKLLDSGFTDSFRHLYPDATGKYTWWSYMFKARENNAGWRIDYFLTSQRIRDRIYKTPIYSDIMGSDHCPVGLELDTVCNGGIWSDECKGTPTATEPEKSVLPPMSPAVKAGVAAGIFAVGFAAGTLVMQKPAPEQTNPNTTDIGFYVPNGPTQSPDVQTTIPENTLPLVTYPNNNNGIAPDYASMSTMELIAKALEINAFINVGTNHTSITRGQYEGWKRAYPVFEELERREDAIYLLGLSASIQSNQDAALACYALQTYYKNLAQRYMPATGEVLIGETPTIKVYEQTQKMTAFRILPTDTGSISYMAFGIEDRNFVLVEWDEQIDPDSINFYVRIVAVDEMAIFSSLEVLVNGLSPEQLGGDGNWLRTVHCQNQGDGVILYGHLSEQVHLDITAWFAETAEGAALVAEAAPILGNATSTESLARYLCGGYARWLISDDNLAALPVYSKLLERTDCIEKLYQLMTTTSYENRYSAYMLLTRNDDFVRKMTTEEKQKVKTVISGMANFDHVIAASMTYRPELVPVGETSSDSFAFYVHMTPETPDLVQLEQYDCFVKVGLLPSGKYTYEDDWTLDMVLLRENDRTNADYIAWKVYDATGKNCEGWIVAAKLGCDSVKGIFEIKNQTGLVDAVVLAVYPVDHDYSLDGDIFVDSSSSSTLIPIS